ncbi:MAG TPA: protoporphyrinogen oxidase [Candidatus Paenibacillus intestinavium]|nr:protoporphyrinogen oxidase [Candidatus Paenibacillus intestinavium]
MRSAETIDTVVVIGGGISGLSSAFYLQKLARESGQEIRIVLVEGEDHLGGKINTLHKDGFVIEKGPDSFLARKLAIIDLAQDLGIEDELVATNQKASKTYIMNKLHLHPMPPGLVLGIPTDIIRFLQSELISPEGKLAALADLLKEARPAERDESLGGFLARRIGTELVAKIAEPLLAGIYAGDLYKLSLNATFPQFAQSEQQFGSVIVGSRHNKRVADAQNNGKKPVTFMTFRKGLSTMVDALEKALSTITLQLNSKVDRLEKSTDGYIVHLQGGAQLQAKGVIMTTPAFVSSKLLNPYINTEALANIRYVSVANVVMAFDRASFGVDFDGSGFLVPRSEGLHITACTWTSNKWLHSSPEDKVLLRCYVGHSEDQQSVKLDDESLIAAVREDIRKSVGVTVEPIFTEITRLNHSMPQYPIGHVDAIRNMRIELSAQLPGVWVTGAAFDGVGLPDCIRQGKAGAQIMLDYLEEVAIRQ